MSTVTVPDIPMDVLAAIDAVVVAEHDCDKADAAGMADAAAVRERMRFELWVAVKRWEMRQIKVTSGFTLEHAGEALRALLDNDTRAAESAIRKLIDTNQAALIGGEA